MPLFDVPETFAQELRTYDPDLRCRWSDARQCYLIERKVSRGKQWPPPAKADPDDNEQMLTPAECDQHNREILDEWTAACEGYVILLNVERDSLDNRVFYTLWATDIWRQGGADAVNERIDRAYWDARRKGKADFGDYVRHMAMERHRYMTTIRTVPESGAHTAPEGGMSINALSD